MVTARRRRLSIRTPSTNIFRLNVLAPIIAMQAVIPLMRASGGGVIVNVNSGTSFMTIPGYSVYSASKRALIGITQTARVELVSGGIVVSEVYPTMTATDFGKNRLGAGGATIDYSAGDRPEKVAGLIVRAITEGRPVFRQRTPPQGGGREPGWVVRCEFGKR